MKTRIFVSIVEPTPERAIEAIRGIEHRSAGVELRVDSFDPDGARSFDPAAIRSCSSRPMIYTRRSGEGRAALSLEELRLAIDAGFDLVDVESDGPIPPDSLRAVLDRIILSLHDFHAVPPLDTTIRTLTRTGAAQIKIAVTPASFDEDRTILETLSRHRGSDNLTIFGMGRHGLYSRTLAPSLGSRISFVALDDERPAAPGQLPVNRAAAMWDTMPSSTPDRLFAIVGNPASHSQSPRIHNARFSEAGVAAAYGIIETDVLGEVLQAMVDKLPCAPLGLSVTAPFKRDLFDEALEREWDISERARRVKAANTLVERGESFFVDNTDVLGFARALEGCSPDSRVAILGAGGTGRSAAFAAFDRGLDITVFNRTFDKADELARLVSGSAHPINDAEPASFDVVIDTLPGEIGSESSLELLKEGGVLVRAAYDDRGVVDERARAMGVKVFGGIDLLEAQAEEQSRQFIEAAGENR